LHLLNYFHVILFPEEVSCFLSDVVVGEIVSFMVDFFFGYVVFKIVV